MNDKVAVKPVEIKEFSLKDASEILENQDPTRLPQWQIHGDPVVVGVGDGISVIKVVMLKLDRIAPPTILTPPVGPIVVPR